MMPSMEVGKKFMLHNWEMLPALDKTPRSPGRSSVDH